MFNLILNLIPFDLKLYLTGFLGQSKDSFLFKKIRQNPGKSFLNNFVIEQIKNKYNYSLG